MPKNWKGGPLGFFIIHSVAKHQKIEVGKFFFRKKSHCRKNWKGGPFGIFQHPLTQNSKKIEGGPFGEKNFPKQKSHSAEKKLKRDPSVSPGKVCYAEKPFWFSSLGQMVQFGAIIFCRTSKNYLGQFVWIEKKKSHYNSRVSLHEAPTKKLKRTVKHSNQ